MSNRIFYNAFNRDITSGSQDDVASLLTRISIEDIHGCLYVPVEPTACCVKCEHLFTVRERDTSMIRLLMEHGAQASV